MKRDIEKIARIKECIKRFYLTVSDSQIAEKFDVTVRSVKVTRHRLGLKKDYEIVSSLKIKSKRKPHASMYAPDGYLRGL